MKKYTAYIEVGYWVDFEDDGETDLNKQAQEALDNKSIRDWDELRVSNIEKME